MTRLEKNLVNRIAQGRENYARLRQRLGAEALAQPGHALELGCGVGTVSALLAADHPALDVTGTDADAEQLKLARNRQTARPNLRFVKADATKLAFPDASFDLVVAQNVFHHLPNWPLAVDEVARVLRPGGRFVWFDLALPAFWRRVLAPFANSAGIYTFDEVQEQFRAVGLVLEQHATTRLTVFQHHDVLLRRAA